RSKIARCSLLKPSVPRLKLARLPGRSTGLRDRMICFTCFCSLLTTQRLDTMNEDRKRTNALLDVAEQAGILRATASLVVRKSPLGGAVTRRRVGEGMLVLGYVYNMGAVRLRAGRSAAIPLGLSCQTSQPFLPSFWAALKPRST